MTCQHLGLKTVLDVYDDDLGTERRLMDGEPVEVEKHTAKVHCHECGVTGLEVMHFPLQE